MNNNLSFKSIFLILLCILLSKSLYYDAFGKNLLLFVFLPIVIVVSKHTFQFKQLLFLCLYLVVPLLNPNTAYSTYVVLLVRLLLAIALVSTVRFSDFTKVFAIFIEGIGVISLLSFIVIYFQISSPLPEFVALDGRHLQNFVLFGVSDGFIEQEVYRNSGLWWEPGAFQLFINLALLFRVIRKELTFKRTIMYIIIVASTGSTTGFISTILLISAVGFTFIGKKKLKKRAFVSFIVMAPIFSILLTKSIPMIAEKFDKESNMYASFLSRFLDFEISKTVFLEHPILGLGYGGYEKYIHTYGTMIAGTYIMNSPAKPTGSDGLSILFAQTGLFAVILIFPLLLPKYLGKISIASKLCIMLSLIIGYNTQNLAFTLLFIVMSFYGLTGKLEFALDGFNDKTV